MFTLLIHQANSKYISIRSVPKLINIQILLINLQDTFYPHNQITWSYLPIIINGSITLNIKILILPRDEHHPSTYALLVQPQQC